MNINYDYEGDGVDLNYFVLLTFHLRLVDSFQLKYNYLCYYNIYSLKYLEERKRRLNYNNKTFIRGPDSIRERLIY